jgi:hypothetical protein
MLEDSVAQELVLLLQAQEFFTVAVVAVRLVLVPHNQPV